MGGAVILRRSNKDRRRISTLKC